MCHIEAKGKGGGKGKPAFPPGQCFGCNVHLETWLPAQSATATLRSAPPVARKSPPDGSSASPYPSRLAPTAVKAPPFSGGLADPPWFLGLHFEIGVFSFNQNH